MKIVGFESYFLGLGHMLCENFNEKNKNSLCSELPKIAMLPKNAV